MYSEKLSLRVNIFSPQSVCLLYIISSEKGKESDFVITGVGLDIVELDRIEKLDNKTEKFRQRILTVDELGIYEKLTGHRKVEFLAGRFAAKEAFSKARGTGIGATCNFTDIQILPAASGRPKLYFKGERVSGFVSITHTKELAAAQVILQA